MIKQLIACLVLPATVIAAGAPARALTGQDAKFLNDFFNYAEPSTRTMAANVDPEAIIKLGRSVCQDLNNGASMDQVIEAQVNSMFNIDVSNESSRDIFIDYISTVNVVGIHNYCPWNINKIYELENTQIEANQTYY